VNAAAEETLHGLVVPPNERFRSRDLSAEQLNDLLSSESETH